MNTTKIKYQYDDLICKNIDIDENGELLFAELNTIELAKKYGTPLYLLDENRVRENCKTYLSAVKQYFDGNASVYFASKALSFKYLYEIMKDEKMCIDVVSIGEIYSAKIAGFPLENSAFHSNNKTDEDIEYAIENGVGLFVVDNKEELYSIDKIAKKIGKIQRILLRLTPGIDSHTYEAVSTGKVDSKFGSAIETGQAEEMTRLALSFENIKLCGFHCHIGSQVFDSSVYLKASEIMLNFVAEMKKKLSFDTEILDLGGGYGVRYIKEQPTIDIKENIKTVSEFLKKNANELEISLPKICFEPGRSIVADAGMTLYNVGTVKKIKGYKNYVSVDGGMTDNPRFALYRSPYTVYTANKMLEERKLTASLVGRCCESGDIIQENVAFPNSVERGDIVATPTTGAYHYSMSSNYNKIPRPPIVVIKDKKTFVAVKRETKEDLCRNEI